MRMNSPSRPRSCNAVFGEEQMRPIRPELLPVRTGAGQPDPRCLRSVVSWFLRAGFPTSAVTAFNLKQSLSPCAVEWEVRLLPILPKLLPRPELQRRAPVGPKAEPKTRP